MSFLDMLKITLSRKWLVEKLTLTERAKLLIDITKDLGFRIYEKEGVYIGEDIEKAKTELLMFNWVDNDLK